MLNRYFLTLLRDATGLDLGSATVSRAVYARMRDLGLDLEENYVLRVQPGSAELNALIDEVVVPETWFFRDSAAFTAACSVVEEKRASGVRPVRILSLPCASGEEPYSMAIALLERGIARGDFVVHGMDVSTAALERARRAVYQRNAFRGTSPAFRARWFARRGDEYTLSPQVRELVEFRRANLLELLPPLGVDTYDVVFCRNLLIYFDEATLRSAIQRVQGLLLPDGVLFSGPAEAAAFCRHGFSMAPFPRAFALTRARERAPRPLNSQRPLAKLTHRGEPRLRPVLVSAPPLAAPGMAPPAPAPLPGKAAPRPPALMQKAHALADQGNLEEAADLFRRCVQLAPESADAHFMLGLLSERMQDFQAAEQSLRRAVYLNPEHYEALCHLALLSSRHGDALHAEALRRRAERVYRRRQETEPGR